MPDWLLFDTVTAPSPRDQNDLDKFAISNTFVEKNNSNHRCTPIFQLWAHVIGKLPPINNISRLQDAPVTPSLTTLHDSVACFSGLQRPHDEEPNGDSVLIYVLNPTVSIKFEASMVCQATALTIPKNTVLTVQVRPNWAGQTNEDEVNGIITRVEFVPSSDANPHLPLGFETRYLECHWKK